jgi:hypothetical protein
VNHRFINGPTVPMTMNPRPNPSLSSNVERPLCGKSNDGFVSEDARHQCHLTGELNNLARAQSFIALFQVGNQHERKVKEIIYPHAKAQIQFFGRSINESVPE